MPTETLSALRELRGAGLSLRKTAEELNARGIRGPQGGRWHDRTVMLAERRYGMG